MDLAEIIRLVIASCAGVLVSELFHIRNNRAAVKKLLADVENTEAVADKLNAETMSLLMTQVKSLISDSADYRKRIRELEEASEIKDTYIQHLEATIKEKEENLERFKSDVRRYLREFVAYLEKKGVTDYPKAPNGIMDTGELMKGKK
jgi:chromosome segregation ATPase